MRRLIDKIATVFLWGTALSLGALIFGTLSFVASQGWEALSWEFIFEPPRDGMTRGGIWTPLLGTLELIAASMAATIPVGVGTGLYFSEYAGDSLFTTIVRQSIRALAGVPSVVFGLFGLSLFVVFLRFGSSLLSASLTLACLSLPLMVTASEQAFRAVSRDYRDASYALGATKWQTIRKVVFPSAAPTIITGVILSVGRVAGETAPIIFTGAAFYTPSAARSLFDEVMALPYHVYVLATAGANIQETRPLQYGAILVLIGLVLGISSVGVWTRARLGEKRQ
ncbi:MAG: phosphate ABC transporter permease PstA [Synergistaceae bacterium]|jgi:phosphate transport system permease protein|nr:phosphate ABC transporter permease PstA [Synergistaceae bacterium]